jgi:hypothetical protein
MRQLRVRYILTLRLLVAVVAAVALTTVLDAIAPVPAVAALPGPSFVYPTDGQTLDYGKSFLFKVNPVNGASGYLYGFFQGGTAVWENYHDEHILSSTEYGIATDSPGHRAIHPGALQVWVRALVDGQWTDATIININIADDTAPDGNSAPNGSNGQPPFYCINGPNSTCNGVDHAVPAGPNACSFSLDQFSVFGYSFDFKESCDKHDKCYMSNGGTTGVPADKDTCDNSFYDNMLSSCRNVQHQHWCTLWAAIYHDAVIAYGEPFFSAPDRAARAGTVDAILQKVQQLVNPPPVE